MVEKRWLTEEERELLRPHWHRYLDMCRFVSDATDDELAWLMSACESCTTINCGWYVYGSAQHLLPEIRAEIRRRAWVAFEIKPDQEPDEIRWADDGGRQAA